MVAEAGRRGEPPRLLAGRVFTDLAEAERFVFELRWQALTPGGARRVPMLTPARGAPPAPLTLAPLPLAKRIIGYCDPLSAAPGEQVRFFVSCDPAISSVRADLVRLRAGRPGRETVGPECDPVPGDCAGTYAGAHQDVHPGSYALIPGGAQALRGGPVSLPAGRAHVPRRRAPGARCVRRPVGRPGRRAHPRRAAEAGPDRRPGGEAVLTGPAALETGAWSVVTATFGGDAPGRLMAGPLTGGGEPWPMVTGPVPVARADPAGAGHGADGTGHPPGVAGPGPGPSAQNLVLGAVMSAAGTTRMHFTGRLESPMIMDGALGPAQARALMTAGPAGAGSVRAAWDFSIGIDTWAVTDRGPHSLHGTLHNLPMRAVRGARWTARHNDWREAPGEYAALHFLADALEDCGWAETFTWTIPDGTPSGFYAARVSSGPHQDFIPLFVRARPRRQRAARCC